VQGWWQGGLGDNQKVKAKEYPLGIKALNNFQAHPHPIVVRKQVPVRLQTKRVAFNAKHTQCRAKLVLPNLVASFR
jgi:hypothetical protein